MHTAVLYCVFNRLDTVKQTIEPIRKAKPPRLYISSDGPRANKEGEKELVESVRKYILDNVDWECDVKTLFRDENVGCNEAMISGVSWFFKNEEMGIIIEDDILTGDAFFDFCEKMLIKYKDDEHVRSICPLALNKNVASDYDYVFQPRSVIWGWASWRRTWEGYDFDIKPKWDKYKKNNWLNTVFTHDVDILMWTRIFDEFTNRYEGSWDYSFVFHNFEYVPKGCYSISTTNKNLLTNIGYEGVHYSSNVATGLGWPIDEMDTNNIKGPDKVELDLEYLNKCTENCKSPEIEDYLKKNLPQKVMLFGRLYLKIFLSFLKMVAALNKDAKKRRLVRTIELKYLLDNTYCVSKMAKIHHKK